MTGAPQIPGRRVEDRDDLIGWLLRPARRVYVGILFLLLCAVFAASWAKISGDENAGCRVQARALPGNRDLARGLQDIADVIAGGDLSRVPPAAAAKLRDLQANAAAYARVQSKQPKTRSC